MGTVYN